MDNGKPFAQSSRIDVPFTVNVLRYFAGLADKIVGQTIPAGKRIMLFECDCSLFLLAEELLSRSFALL